MDRQALSATAQALVAPGKGILAADESTPTIQKRFASINTDCTETSRRDYREMLLTTPQLENAISGVILFDETLHQDTSSGLAFPTLLQQRGIIPGIKVDKGAKPLSLFEPEKVTEGLDGLRERCEAYYQKGARFTKWRAVIQIGPDIPSFFCLLANAHALARFAAISQAAGLVPIVEPEVLIDGNHSLKDCEAVSAAIWQLLFDQLAEHGVYLEGLLLKASMVLSGQSCKQRATIQEVAEATLRCLKEHVPAAVPGIVFLSGGQSATEATAHLNAMNQMGPHPWELSFSYARALQGPALSAWRGQADNVPAAQAALLERAQQNSAARYGKATG